jgi:hypothetical protein
MKKVILSLTVACVFILSTASGCSSDDDNSTTTPANPTPVITTVTQGTWRITSYIDSDNDETNHFTGYNFTFASGSLLTATNGTNTYTGTWSVTNSDSNDDNPSNDLDFNIFFSTPVDFSDLSDDWDIASRTDTKIQLIDVSGGNGGTDYLTFEKN